MPHVAAGTIGDQHAHGEKLKRRGQNLRAVAFHIEIVAPPSDGLRQQHAGGQHIRQRQKVQLFPPGIKKHGQHPAENPAVDGNAALPDIQNRNGIRPELVETHEHVVEPRAHNPGGDRPQGQIDDRVLGQLPAAFFFFRQQNGAENAHDDQRTVPADPGQKVAVIGNRQAFRPFPKFYSL